jgi:anaerobic magnesium-protoporphyrin IX monomethyl ester cyclase
VNHENDTPTIEARKPYRRLLLVSPPMAPMGAEFMMEDVPLRLEYLAAYVRPHVDDIEVLDLASGSQDLDSTLRRFAPDLVGISVNYISTQLSAFVVAAAAKRAGADVVVGGYHATAIADQFAVSPDIDLVVRGEGEQTLLEIVEGRPREQILGLTYLANGVIRRNEDRPLIEDLDTLPFPERHLRKRKYRLPFADLESDSQTEYDMIITSRGCWGKCTFCTEPIMSHGTQRYRSPGKIVEEIEEIVALHRGKRLRLHIADPNFGGNTRALDALCDALIVYRARCATDIHFFVSVRTSTIANHPHLARKMVDAGMDYMFVGMESPRKEDLKAVSKGAEGREKQERAARYLKENGVAVMSCFLLGLPGQTEESALGLVDYAKELELTDCYFSVMTPLPGSKLYDEALANGTLVEKDCTKYRLYDMVIEHDVISRAKMRELCVRCNAKWYDDLMLRQEHRRWMADGTRKRRLYDFAGKFKVLVGFFSFIGSDASNEFGDMDPALFVKDMPNPGLRRFTEENKIHNFLEMRRFLAIVGRQKIQVSLETESRPVVSWVMKTRPGSVEYLDAITGRADDTTLSINIAIDRALTPVGVLRRILADNRNLKSRVALARLAAAACNEVAAGYVSKAREGLRSRAAAAAGGTGR